LSALLAAACVADEAIGDAAPSVTKGYRSVPQDVGHVHWREHAVANTLTVTPLAKPTLIPVASPVRGASTQAPRAGVEIARNKQVFAHYMLCFAAFGGMGNQTGYKQEMAIARDSGVDGFAVEYLGRDSCVPHAAIDLLLPASCVVRLTYVLCLASCVLVTVDCNCIETTLRRCCGMQ
jgi:hypothetical protein